jgi:hypothetical protein
LREGPRMGGTLGLRDGRGRPRGRAKGIVQGQGRGGGGGHQRGEA